MPNRLPKDKDTGNPMREFVLLAGVHCDARGSHKRGDKVYATQDLVALHGREKFRPNFKYGDDQDYTEHHLYETEVGQETADEIAARVRAEVMAEAGLVPKQCSLFMDCLLPNGHKGPCGFARPDAEQAKGKPPTAPPLEPISNKPKPSNQPNRNLSNASTAPKVPVTKVKSPTSQYDDLSIEELKQEAADEEVDVTNCKTKEDYIKALSSK